MTSTASPRFLQIGDLVLDGERNCLLRDGEAVRLEPRVTALLTYLAEADGRVVTKEELIREVWRTHVVDEAVHRAVSLLRSALGDDPRAPKLVETVPGKGYRLLTAATSVKGPIVVQRPTRPMMMAAAAGLAAGVLLTLAALSLSRGGPGGEPAYAPEAPTPSPTAQPAVPVYAPEAPRP